MKAASSYSPENIPAGLSLRLVFITFLRFFLIFALLLGMSTLSSVMVTAKPLLQETTEYTTFLPLVMNNKARLVAPQNGAVLNTLIPEFQWLNYVQEDFSVGCMGLGTSPHPDCMLSYGEWEQLFIYRPWNNLLPGTTYYWRVATILNDDYENPVWGSEEWSFTTAPAGGQVPAAPQLQSPADNAVIPQSSLIFTWKAVSGSSEYAVFLNSPADYLTMISFATGTSLDSRYDYGLKANNQYYWSVKARNEYAWGPSSTKRGLSLTSVNTINLQNSIDPNPPAAWSVDDQTMMILPERR